MSTEDIIIPNDYELLVSSDISIENKFMSQETTVKRIVFYRLKQLLGLLKRQWQRRVKVKIYSFILYANIAIETFMENKYLVSLLYTLSHVGRLST